MIVLGQQVERWEQFLETPLAELEKHGLDTRTIMILEDEFGIHVSDLSRISPKEVLRVRQIGWVSVQKLQSALGALLSEIGGMS